MAHSTDVVGFAYEADLHCVDCAIGRFGPDIMGQDPAEPEDDEGNPISPVFDGEDAYSEDGAPYCCGDCGSALVE